MFNSCLIDERTLCIFLDDNKSNENTKINSELILQHELEKACVESLTQYSIRAQPNVFFFTLEVSSDIFKWSSGCLSSHFMMPSP